MASQIVLLFVVVVILSMNFCAGVGENNEFYRVCYFTNWSQYRKGDARFTVADIDPYLCTHIVYSFAKIDKVSVALKTAEWNDAATIKQMMDLKKQNAKLKILIGVGGWNHEEDDSPFSYVSQNSVRRSIFIRNVVRFVRFYGFDGLDLDWEYPAVRPHDGALPEDKQRFSFLCAELMSEFEKEAISSSRERLILSSAVASSKETVDKAYEVKEIAKSLDFINLLTYDLYGSWNNFTYHHTSMNGSVYTVPKSIQLWLSRGMPANKICLGIATYAQTWTLDDPSLESGLYAPAKNPGQAGSLTIAPGILASYELCQMYWEKTVTKNIALGPYAYSHDLWASYDDEESLRYKIDSLVMPFGLRGIMAWTLDFDDFKGTLCNKGKYPLLNAVKKILRGHEATLAALKTPSTKSTKTRTTATPTNPTTMQTTTTTAPTTTTTTTTTIAPTTTTTTTTVPTTTTTTSTITTTTPETTITNPTSPPTTTATTVTIPTTTTTTSKTTATNPTTTVTTPTTTSTTQTTTAGTTETTTTPTTTPTSTTTTTTTTATTTTSTIPTTTKKPTVSSTITTKIPTSTTKSITTTMSTTIKPKQSSTSAGTNKKSNDCILNLVLLIYFFLILVNRY